MFLTESEAGQNLLTILLGENRMFVLLDLFNLYTQLQVLILVYINPGYGNWCQLLV